MGCDKTSPLTPTETSPAFQKHQTEHTDSRDGEFEIRGFEDCFGELVIVTGTLRFKEQAVTSIETGNVDHSSVIFFLNGTGVGQTTGAVYTFPQPNVQIKLALHVVITGQGVTKVVVDSDKGPCSRA